MKVFVLKLVGLLSGAATFGVIGSPVLPWHWLLSSLLMASCFGFFFLLGAGYRILIAVPLKDRERNTATTWSGAIASSAMAVFFANLLAPFGQETNGILLVAYGLAINVAYLCVKFACLAAGCCGSKHPHPQFMDLRWIEIWISLLILWICTYLLLGQNQHSWIATIGVGGHLGLRLLSRHLRDCMPKQARDLSETGIELVPLASLLCLSLLM